MSHVQVKPVKVYHALEAFKVKREFIEVKAKDATGAQTSCLFLPMEDVQKFELNLGNGGNGLSILCENFEIIVGEGDPKNPAKSLEALYTECTKYWVAGQRD